MLSGAQRSHGLGNSPIACAGPSAHLLNGTDLFTHPRNLEFCSYCGPLEQRVDHPEQAEQLFIVNGGRDALTELLTYLLDGLAGGRMRDHALTPSLGRAESML